MKTIIALQRSRFVWLNLLFVMYLAWVQPVVLQRLVDAEHRTGPDWLLGGLLLGIQGFELLGLLLKRPVGAYYARRYPDDSRLGGWRDNLKVLLLVFAPILHLCLAAVLTLIALDVLWMGMGMEVSLTLQCLSLVLFFAALTKEAFFVTLLLGIGLAGSAKQHALAPSNAPAWAQRINGWLSPPAADQITYQDMLKDIAGDLLLLTFTALSYTATWEMIMASSPLRTTGSERFFAYLGLSLFFFMIYFANRAVYLMQELSIQQSRVKRALSVLSFLAVWLTALWFIPV